VYQNKILTVFKYRK